MSTPHCSCGDQSVTVCSQFFPAFTCALGIASGCWACMSKACRAIWACQDVYSCIYLYLVCASMFSSVKAHNVQASVFSTLCGFLRSWRHSGPQPWWPTTLPSWLSHQHFHFFKKICLCVCLCEGASWYPEIERTRVTCGHEPHHVGARHRALILWKCSKPIC